ncbi:Prostaglandin reductase 1 [Eumeta japonica]|uniref:Prostaglandin reductase 1 n=1 Tax=Eumeta variegata TaxID=151549 RepID=A0A4C1VE98_EUMVA|nr:Prostaglandin reductase 1 [Eumeta japonica]
MVRAKKYVVCKHFVGVPKRDDFQIVEEELPPLQHGQFLVKAEYISVDPCQRSFNKHKEIPYEQFSYQVAIVIESKNSEYPVGTRVVSHEGWRDYVILDPSSRERVGIPGLDTIYKLPDLQNLPISYGIGAVGMPGATAYFGFLEICQPRAGETLVVSGAAGAVGSLVGQIGKVLGLRVIGFAGSDDKVQWLTGELGFDHAYNYRTVNLASALNEAAPNGVDCYFDNVGGEFSSTIMAHMNQSGRVSISGFISSYNDDPSETAKASIVQPPILFKQLRVEGFNVSKWMDRWPEAFKELTQWIKSGKIIVKEHITEGFENIYDAFVGMLAGENKGKAVVKI